MLDQMQKAVDYFRESIVGIRSNTVSPGLIDPIKVDYYGQATPIKHLAQTGKTDQRIFIDPHDLSMIGKITTKLKASGFDAYQFSKQRVIVNIPPISGDERKKIIKQLHKMAEESRVAIRNVRKAWRQSLTKEELEGKEKYIQETTDKAIGCIEELLDDKLSAL